MKRLRLKTFITKLLSRRYTLDRTVCDGVNLSIVEVKFINSKNNLRCIEDDRGGWYSAIYLDQRQKFQPILGHLQRLIDGHFDNSRGSKNALVLGCAGCSLVRYIAHAYRQCHIVGVEYSKPMIDIARKHFFADDYPLFRLIEADAFRFVEGEEEDSYDLICVDLFNQNHICAEVFSKSFINNLYRILRKNGIVVVNAFGCNDKDIKPDGLLPFTSYNISNDRHGVSITLTK